MSTERHEQNKADGKSGNRKANRRRRGRHRPKSETDAPAKATKGDQFRNPDPRGPRQDHGQGQRSKSKHNKPSAPGRPATGSSRPHNNKDRSSKGSSAGATRAARRDLSPRLVKDLSQPTDAALRESPPTNTDFHHIKRRYGLAIYDSFAQAKADLNRLKELVAQFDQLNIVIRAEGNMDDPELNAIGPVKVFAGAAWSLIHERRQQDGWYEQPQ